MYGNTRKSFILISLILAGESIFFLPFIIPRVFRPTMLVAFDISNTELGSYFSIYGVIAMISYLFGGTMADRFSVRNLMAIALWLTSLGGVFMSLIPSGQYMIFLYGFWGFTTIFLFWGALIRATREWGGLLNQGKAFGFLEGGRGISAALMASVALLIFANSNTNTGGEILSDPEKHSFQIVILAISGITFLTGILVYLILPKYSTKNISQEKRVDLQNILNLLSKPEIWLLSIIIICAYAAYKVTDDFSLFAREVLGFSEVKSIAFGTTSIWVRALVAILTGLLSDKFDKLNFMTLVFGLTLTGGLLIGFGATNPISILVFMNLGLVMIGVYSLRSLYFAVMQESKIPIKLTGTAVGIVSFVGFAPEIFMGPWMGHLLDKYPGITGHQHVFLILSIFAFIGLLTSLVFKFKFNAVR